MAGGEAFYALDGALGEVASHDTMTAPMLDGYLVAVLLQDSGKFVLRERHLKDILGQADFSKSEYLDEATIRRLITARCKQLHRRLWSGDLSTSLPPRIDRRQAVSEWAYGFLFALRKSYSSWAPLLASRGARILFPILRHAYGYDERVSPDQALADISNSLQRADEFLLDAESRGATAAPFTIIQLNQLIAEAQEYYQPPVPMVVPQTSARTPFFRRGLDYLRNHRAASYGVLALASGSVLTAALLDQRVGNVNLINSGQTTAGLVPLASEVSAIRGPSAEETALTVSLDNTKRAYEEQSNRLATLAAENAALLGEREVLKSELTSAQSLLGDLKTSDSESLAARQNIERLEAEKTALQSELAAAKGQGDAAIQQTASLNEQLASLQQEREGLSIQLASARQELDALRQAGQATGDLEAAVTQSETRIAELTGQLDELTAARDTWSSERATLAEQLAAEKASAEALAAEKAALQTELAAATEGGDAAIQQTASLNEQLTSLQQEREGLSTQLASARQELNKLRQSGQTTAELQRAVQEREARITAMTQEMDQMAAMYDGLTRERIGLNNQLKVLQANTQGLQAQLVAANGKDIAISQQNFGLGEQLSRLQSERSELMNRLASAEEELAQLRHSGQNSGRATEELQGAVQERDNRITAMAAEMDQLRAELTRSQEALAEQQRLQAVAASKQPSAAEPVTLASIASIAGQSELAAPLPEADSVAGVQASASIAGIERLRRGEAEGVAEVVKQRFKLGTDQERAVLVDEIARGAPMEDAFQTAFGESHALIVSGLCREFPNLCRK
ncbi:MAG: hypothetical protein ACK5LJ_01765 [Paracoccus sp. (in: a-proteobacteria)]